MCDSGVALSALIRTGADAVGIDSDPGVLAAVTARLGEAAGVCQLRPPALPFESGSISVVTSLFTIGFTPDTALVVSDIRRILAPGGRVVMLLWAQTCSAEQVLADAFAASDVRSPFLDALLEPCLGDASWLDAITLRDVARFNDLAHFWQGMVVERPLGDELLTLGPATAGRIRARCAELLAPHTAADGTLRVPVEARCLTR